jgi:hypothetical protein
VKGKEVELVVALTLEGAIIMLMVGSSLPDLLFKLMDVSVLFISCSAVG